MVAARSRGTAETKGTENRNRGVTQEEGGPEIQLEIEVRKIESEMIEVIRDLCRRKAEVGLRVSIDEIEEQECQDLMSA